MDRLPTVCFCGHGRSGKDEAGVHLYRTTPLRYVGSLSWIGLPIVAARLQLPEQVAWETRHANRLEWMRILNEYRASPGPDGVVNHARLIRDSLARGEIVVGVREGQELLSARQQGLLDHVIWVERPGTPLDPTVTYSAADCDTVLVNDGTLVEWQRRVSAWARSVKIPQLS